MALTKAQILAKRQVKVKEVDCPELGGSVYVRTMTAAERIRLDTTKNMVRGVEAGLIIGLIRHSVCDKDGKLLFGDEDIEALLDLEFKVCEQLSEAALAFNSLSEEKVEEAAGNSNASPSDS